MGMLLMYLVSLVLVLVAAVRYCFPGCRRKITKPPAAWGTGRKPTDDLAPGQTVSLRYHILQMYIDIIEKEKFHTGVEIVG